MHRHKIVLILAVLFLLVGAGSVGAQAEVVVVQVGVPAENTLPDAETPVVYRFEAAAGELLVIEAFSDTVDTYFFVFDAQGTVLAENDDYSAQDLNPYVEFKVPASGVYFVVVYGYTGGQFAFVINAVDDSPTPPPTSTGDTEPPKGTIYTGTITKTEYYAEIPLLNVQEGSTISIDAVATSGDLDLYLLLYYGDTLLVQNDDRTKDDPNPLLIYTAPQTGDYRLIVTRYAFDQGLSTGDFQVTVQFGASSPAIDTVDIVGDAPVTPQIPRNYPDQPAAPQAEWTLLVYLGGDNNLEDGLLNDMNEFEIAGGSTEAVRILVLMDRSGEYDNSNGDWDDTRLFEMGPDRSQDSNTKYPPTIDTQPLAILGELDTSYSRNLYDFLVWGITKYPAKHYAVILNDHGNSWTGIVTDDTTGYGILSIRDLQQTFQSVLRTTGLTKFDLLINDACLMSSVEYYTAIAPYFDFVYSSPEVMLVPGFDMTLLTTTLNRTPDIDLQVLGEMLADKYLGDVRRVAPSEALLMSASVTDLRAFQTLTEAVENFAGVINDNPAAYASLVGRVRSNTYTYSFFLPEDQFGPATSIDVGHFMLGIIELAPDENVKAAAQGVLNALNTVHVYGIAGEQLARASSFYNIYFPSRGSDFINAYNTLSPLSGWAEMLAKYYTSVSAGGFKVRSAVAAPTAAPSVVPVVSITNIYPTEASVLFPATISMEVVGRNIARGTFTVDQLQPDGTAVRLDTARIVTTVVKDGVADYINQWESGVDDSNFTWEVMLPVVTDGTTAANELVSTLDGVTSLAGRYRYPDTETWVDVTVVFDGSQSASVLGRQEGGAALGNIRLLPGGEFQTYRSIVGPDGQIQLQPGTSYQWTENGLSWYDAPAPSGQYNLGFLVEAFGGAAGFGSALITVNNTDVPDNLRGYVDLSWGIRFSYPVEDWYDVVYFPDDRFLQASSYDSSQYVLVYTAQTDSTALEMIAQDVLQQHGMTLQGDFTPVTVAGENGLAFDLSYSNSLGSFVGRAVAVYLADRELGLVFSAETLEGGDYAALYELVTNSLVFFDPEEIEAQDTGVWDVDLYTQETRYPVPKTWMPGFENGFWWFYTPNNDTTSRIFAGVTVLNESPDAPNVILAELLTLEVETKSGYTLLNLENYYGENHTWQVATYTHTEGGSPTVGRMYVMVINNVPYVLWFEAPEAEAERLFREVFDPMLDGFKVREAA